MYNYTFGKNKLCENIRCKTLNCTVNWVGSPGCLHVDSSAGCSVNSWNREFWMSYRGPGFFAVVWFGTSPPRLVSKLDRQHTWRLWKRNNLLTGEGGKGVGEEPNHTTARKPSPLKSRKAFKINILCPEPINNNRKMRNSFFIRLKKGAKYCRLLEQSSYAKICNSFYMHA